MERRLSSRRPGVCRGNWRSTLPIPDFGSMNLPVGTGFDMMTEEQFHSGLVWTVFVIAVVTFASLQVLAAPYGRYYAGKGWGPHLSNRASWVLMEFPSAVLFLCVHLSGAAAFQTVPLVLLGIWQCHYLNRTFVYPLRIRAAGKKMPLLVMACGFTFNCINAYLNARFISEFGEYGSEWLADPRFLAGGSIFLAGLALNIHSDGILLRLRKPGEAGYAIPRGGAFRYVSCPELPGRDRGMGGLGAGDLVAGRTGHLRLHRGQPDPESAQSPSVVPGTFPRLPGRPKIPDSRSDLITERLSSHRPRERTVERRLSAAVPRGNREVVPMGIVVFQPPRPWGTGMSPLQRSGGFQPPIAATFSRRPPGRLKVALPTATRMSPLH